MKEIAINFIHLLQLPCVCVCVGGTVGIISNRIQTTDWRNKHVSGQNEKRCCISGQCPELTLPLALLTCIHRRYAAEMDPVAHADAIKYLHPITRWPSSRRERGKKKEYLIIVHHLQTLWGYSKF